MKTLVIFYSRTGITKKVADVIARKTGAELEELRDTQDRSGIKGYVISGRDATLRRQTRLEKIGHDPSDYDLVMIGTPIWSWNMSVPVRTYLSEHKDSFNEIAFFCTMGSSGDKRAFSEMGEIVGKNPLGTVSLKTVDVVKNNFEHKLDEFVKAISDRSG